MNPWRLFLLIAIALLLPVTLIGSAQPASAQDEPVAYGVFFHSPTCPHCREVLENHWPGIQAEFGDRLRVLFVNVATPAGRDLMLRALPALGIESSGVPLLVLGDTYLSGSIQIPREARDVIRAGLAAGGIPMPAIPGIEAIFAEAMAAQPADDAAAEPAQSAAAAPGFNADPANLIAVVVLAGLAISLIVVAIAAWQARTQANAPLVRAIAGSPGRMISLLAALGGLALTVSLIFGSVGNGVVALLAGIVAVIFILYGALLLTQPADGRVPGLALPLVVLAGLIVAGYLAYVETTLTEAVCGLVGDCNAVQQSPYASVAGIPVGVIGIAGYLVIGGLWLLRRLRPARWIDAALFGAALFGVAFSTYLTFLEPFVIGASCVWCLTSAVLMIILVWLTAPAGLAALTPEARARQTV
ncbi:MAG: vitamin K epoxide reductase family protein [Candidatus Flexifilum sp.]